MAAAGADSGADKPSRRPLLHRGVRHAGRWVALATFFRMPGVLPLIERADAERQTASELGLQEAQREEAEKVESGYYDRKSGETPPA